MSKDPQIASIEEAIADAVTTLTPVTDEEEIKKLLEEGRLMEMSEAEDLMMKGLKPLIQAIKDLPSRDAHIAESTGVEVSVVREILTLMSNHALRNLEDCIKEQTELRRKQTNQ